MKKAYLNWSSGKDAAFALYDLQKKKSIEVSKLVTTVNIQVDRISMHGVRKALLLRQAESLGLALHIIPLDGTVSMEAYNKIMKEHVERLKEEGFTHSIFGDIFLEDLKTYREQEMSKIGIKPMFPLWKKGTGDLVRNFIKEGFKAVTVCVNSKFLDNSFCGREIDESFLRDLPEGVDPCGENGEFHTFVYDGPIFKNPVTFEIGEKVERFYKPTEEKDECFTGPKSWDTGFWYCDLIPK